MTVILIFFLFKVENFVLEQIRLHRETLESPLDYTDMLLTAQSDDSITDHAVMATLIDLILAGTDTTASVMSWVVAYLTTYPKYQTEIQEELKKSNSSQTLDMVLKEVLRIRPVAAIAVPHLTTEEVTVQGYTIPANSMIIANLWGAMRDKDFCQDPLDFQPERWQNGDLDNFIPFGVGPRECVGKSLANMILKMALPKICALKMKSSDVSLKPKFSLVVYPHEFHINCCK